MTKLPTTGPLPKPKSPDEAREVLKAEAFPAPNAQRVVLTTTEFTSICPRTGQPDFDYLWSFRDEGAFCESLAARIADDVVYAVAPRALRVRVHQNVRGGIALVAEAVRGRWPA